MCLAVLIELCCLSSAKTFSRRTIQSIQMTVFRLELSNLAFDKADYFLSELRIIFS